MPNLESIIIGGGQAGLAMGRCLVEHQIHHVILERGRIAERWRSERWDSLRLLTPNFLSRLPHWRYEEDDPDGYMTVSEVIAYLDAYAQSFNAPILTGMTVKSLARSQTGFIVKTGSQDWQASTVVIATGHCDTPFVPEIATHLNSDILQLTSSQYRNPNQLTAGGVLVVGAGASGLQIAEELMRAGRSVTIAVGRHRRRPRQYRERDILWWVDKMGIFHQPADSHTERCFPAPQLVGSDEGRSLDLGILQSAGVKLVGRIAAIDNYRVSFESNLNQVITQAEQEMQQLLASIDHYAIAHNLKGTSTCPKTISPCPPPKDLNLQHHTIRTVIWATGYRRKYPWLELDLLDQQGEIRHIQGITEEPGLYVLGLRRQRHNSSNFIGGVGDDAMFLAEHLSHYLRQS
ncbi:MAG: NAD(P)-binding domain-containing protein [Acaryochloris sp. RU_4_1]|nr:NAD(P)-binding domain-containing protein [Acaryochloris sp. RU_4_1]NJR54636.1 NAD(P)-binding domain-containing protein [Acaryochloris sp. CRU_2_0]